MKQARQVARGGARGSDGKNEQGVDEEQHCVEGMNGTGGRGEAPPPSMPSLLYVRIIGGFVEWSTGRRHRAKSLA